ncbi:hypothetical protein [Aquimarina algicola]|uniref:Uncharacterized protein n=1 Tax=Aquimarina algicola TaxID=2589995 RepID=A0A504JJ78_9FLAO|nr:hypothetical protein [Aquimarina algicola]TPN87908.1 hypothetical protein FHK87_10065 [Aquimarina algicola]
MKKIILTLGILLGTISTYAMNTNLKLSTEDKNETDIVSEEDTSCTRINRIFNEHGDVVAIIEEPC